MALGPDGRPYTAEERRTQAVERLITSTIPLERKKTEARQFFSVNGPAAALLSADLCAQTEHDNLVDLVVAASSRQLIDSLHSESFLKEPVRNFKQEIIRFDGNGFLRAPSALARSLGAVRYTYCQDYGTQAARLVLSAEACSQSLGRENTHPCFDSLGNTIEHAQLHLLLAEAMSLVAKHLGTIILLPNSSCTGFDLCYWRTWDRVELKVISPADTIQQVCDEIRTDRCSHIRSQMPANDERTAAENAVLASLSNTRAITMSDFVDLVLPAESQAVLAYEGLYRCETETERTPGLAVTFGGRNEGKFASDWGKLFNHIVASKGLRLGASRSLEAAEAPPLPSCPTGRISN